MSNAGGSGGKINCTTKEYTSDVAFPFNQNRSTFMVVVTAGSASVGFGGGAKIPLAQGEHYAPYVCPISSIEIDVVGSVIVTSDIQVS